jgi:hypothetical protein
MRLNFASRVNTRRVMLAMVFLLLAGCATTASTGSGDLAQLHLFGDASSPRFSFYFSCAGSVSAETEMCWVPSTYFAQWADARHVPIKELPDQAAFDAALGVPADQVAKSDSGFDYRVVVRFVPVATPSYSSEVDGMGGYTAPKAGYRADLFVYSGANGKLVTQVSLHKNSQARFKADAVPYVKAGVAAILAALDPAYAQASGAEH